MNPSKYAIVILKYSLRPFVGILGVYDTEDEAEKRTPTGEDPLFYYRVLRVPDWLAQ